MTPTDILIRKIQEMRPALDAATGRTGVSIRAILEHGTIEVTAKVTQIEQRGR